MDIRSIMRPVTFSLVFTLAACASPSLTDRTPASLNRSYSDVYPIRALVDPNGNKIVDVEAIIDGSNFVMIPTSSPPSNSPASATVYIYDHDSGCSTTIPYRYVVKYRKKNLIGSGYLSTVEEKRFPAAGGFVARVVEDPLWTQCSVTIGHRFEVNSTVDAVDINPGDGLCQTSVEEACTLRAAIMESNASPGHDYIDVLPANSPYILSLTGDELVDSPDDSINDLDLTEGLTIVGGGRDGVDGLNMRIDAEQVDRIFDIYGAAEEFVSLENLTLQNGRAEIGGGGAIWNRGNLRIDRLLMRNNLTLPNPSCARNYATRVCNRGGALLNEGQTLITRSTITGNSTGHRSGLGGGISNFGPNAKLFLEASTITGNDARFSGGIINWEGAVNILNSTFTDNEVTTGYPSGVPTEIGNRDGVITVKNTTFSTGGTLFLNSGSGEMTFSNSLIDFVYTDYPFCRGTLQSSGFNVIGGASGGSPSNYTHCNYRANPTDKVNAMLSLDSLRDNGGQTQTREPFGRTTPTFYPVDFGGVDCPPTDQRGEPRSDGLCDAGAFEVQP